jgi:hypothetical protein
MKEIPLTQGQVAIIDDEDLPLVSQYKWCAQYSPCTGTYYAIAYTKGGRLSRRRIQMHRLILNAPDEDKVDHVHRHETLDNRRENIRLCTVSQNQANRGKFNINCSSHFKGVCRSKGKHCWQAYITHNRKALHLGYFDSEVLAALAYNRKAVELFGEFAYLNQIPPTQEAAPC